MSSRSALAVFILIVVTLAAAAGCAPSSGPPAEGGEAAEQVQVDPWEAIFDRLDQAGSSIWSASAKVRRYSPHEATGYLHIFAAEARKVLTPEELASLDVDEQPFVVILLRFENHTTHSVWVFGSSPDSFTLVDNQGRSYKPFNPLLSDTLAKVPLPLLERSPTYCLDSLVPEARAYMTLIFPEVRDGIKLVYIQDSFSADYEATLRFNK